MYGTKSLSEDKSYQRFPASFPGIALHKEDGSQGLVPSPAPLAPFGVTYTFLVTQWDIDCAAASLVAPVHT